MFVVGCKLWPNFVFGVLYLVDSFAFDSFSTPKEIMPVSYQFCFFSLRCSDARDIG